MYTWALKIEYEGRVLVSFFQFQCFSFLIKFSINKLNEVLKQWSLIHTLTSLTLFENLQYIDLSEPLASYSQYYNEKILKNWF